MEKINKQLIIIVIMLTIALLMCACGHQPSDNPSQTPTETPEFTRINVPITRFPTFTPCLTYAPTATPTAQPTPTPTSAPTSPSLSPYTPTPKPTPVPIATYVSSWGRQCYVYEWDVDVIAKMCYAEANDQPDFGIRLVIDVILNRMRKVSLTTDAANAVLYSDGQWACLKNGHYDKAPYNWTTIAGTSIRQLIYEELNEETNYEVYYFDTYGRAMGYNKHGEKVYKPYGILLYGEKIGNHYYYKEINP